MKKRLPKAAAVTILILAVHNKIFSADIGQKIFPTSCDEYKYICDIYTSQGMALPSSTGPWSANELSQMMNRIDRNNLDDAFAELYDTTYSLITREPEYNPEEKFGFSMNLDLRPEIYFHTDTKNFSDRNSFSYDEMKMNPFFILGAEGFADIFYGYFSLDLKNHANTGASASYSSQKIGSTLFSSNIPAMQNFRPCVYDIDTSFPDRAFISTGGTNWSMQIGKDRLCWGNGVTGNLLISDNIPYHNFFRLTTFFDSFKYSFLLDNFQHPNNYTKTDQNEANVGLRFAQIHRFEISMLNKKLRWYLTESIMYNSADGTVDLSIINPLYIMHNLMIRGMSNSITTLEFDYAPVNHINIYGQFALDEMAVVGEPKESEVEDGANPNALGYLLGCKANYPLFGGILYGSLEGAFTDPFLYLRDGTDFVVGLRRNNAEGIDYNHYFLGYEYGGDSIVANLNCGWKKPLQYGIEGNIFFMIHGTFDKDTEWTRIGKSNYKDCQTPTSAHVVNSKNPDAYSRSGTRNILDLGLNGFYFIRPNIKAHANINSVNVWNADYHGANCFDFQTAMGVDFSW